MLRVLESPELILRTALPIGAVYGSQETRFNLSNT